MTRPSGVELFILVNPIHWLLLQKLPRLRRLIALVTINMLFSGVAQAAVWRVINPWDSGWEKQYSEWIQANWKTDFFMRSDRPAFYKLPHDCGDAPYFARIAFSYLHQLPFAINDPARPGKKITQADRRFDRIPAGDKRLRAFLDFIGDRVSSNSLPEDTYPIALKAIRPGDLYVSPGNHNYQIAAISAAGIPTLLSSTTPRKPRYLLVFNGFPMFVPSDMKTMRDGYRRFRKPQDIGRPMEGLPDFSVEQYKMARAADYKFLRFSNALAVMLGARQETSREELQRMVDEMCNLVTERTDYVRAGVTYLNKIRKAGRRCMNRDEFDQYSTVSRDARLGSFFHQTRKTMNQKMMSGADPEMISLLQAIFQPQPQGAGSTRRLNAVCEVDAGIEKPVKVNLNDVWKAVRDGRLESDPHAPLLYRWGLMPDAWVPVCHLFGE